MKVYALTFTVGIESGLAKLIGIYDTRERAQEVRDWRAKKYSFDLDDYNIEEIELNDTLDIVYAEW